MTPSKMSDAQLHAHGQSALSVMLTLLRSRIGLASLAGAVVVAGLAFNWSWLVAAGIAPLMISLAPCAVMCALGLCMTQMNGKGAATGPAADPTLTPNPTPTQLPSGNDPLEAQVSGDGVYKVE